MSLRSVLFNIDPPQANLKYSIFNRYKTVKISQYNFYATK